MSKILTAKDKIKQICSLIGGVALCVYILVPFVTALLIGLSLLVSKENFLFHLFAPSILEAVAFGASGFLMALIISYFSVSREISTTLFGSLIVATFFVVHGVIFIPILPRFWKIYRLLEIVLQVVFLLGFAILGSWLVARKRRLRVQKGA